MHSPKKLVQEGEDHRAVASNIFLPHYAMNIGRYLVKHTEWTMQPLKNCCQKALNHGFVPLTALLK